MRFMGDLPEPKYDLTERDRTPMMTKVLQAVLTGAMLQKHCLLQITATMGRAQGRSKQFQEAVAR